MQAMEATCTHVRARRHAMPPPVPSPDRSQAYKLSRGSWLPSVVAQARMELPRTTEAPRLARQQMRDEAGAQLERSERELVEVLTTELVSNAVMHPGPQAGDKVRLHFAVAPERIRVEVCDDGAGFCAEQLEMPRTRPGGYGLMMVERGSSRWGAARGQGNCVWFELDRHVAGR